jgi:hypothetical protein
MTGPQLGETPLSELEELAKITPADIERAKAAWKRSAPPAAKKLLDARLETPAKCRSADRVP